MKIHKATKKEMARPDGGDGDNGPVMLREEVCADGTLPCSDTVSVQKAVRQDARRHSSVSRCCLHRKQSVLSSVHLPSLRASQFCDVGDQPTVDRANLPASSAVDILLDLSPSPNCPVSDRCLGRLTPKTRQGLVPDAN